MKPIDHCFTLDPSKRTIFEPLRFTKFSMPVICAPWYRRRELSLRETLAQNSMKA
jgi:hypothetical protein